MPRFPRRPWILPFTTAIVAGCQPVTALATPAVQYAQALMATAPRITVHSVTGCQPFTVLTAPAAEYTEQVMATAPRITAHEVKQRLSKGEMVIIVDVRPVDAYRQEHITGSVNFPRLTLASSESPLPKDTPIVLYCTCRSEHSAAAAALDLEKQGHTNVCALAGGLGGWKAAGYETEKPDSPEGRHQ